MPKILSLLTLLVGAASPACCWAEFQDVNISTNHLDVTLGSGKICVGSGEFRTGSLSANTNYPGWGITKISLMTTIDGRDIPPPISIYSSTTKSSLVTSSGSSGYVDASVQTALEAAKDSGQRHVYGMRILVEMEDDQGNIQITSSTGNAG